jgi:hypothetical protein
VCNAGAVKLLEAEHQAAPPAPPEAPSPETEPLPEGTTACRTCGAPMEPGQDWCLACGTAAKGTLGQRPGWRAARTVIALTALLVLGAAAASYAALTDDGAQPPAASTPVAQVPAAATPPAATPAPPAATTPAKPKKLPTVKAPKATSTPTPAPSPATPTPAPATPAPSSSSGTSTGSSSTGSSTGSSSGSSGGSSSTTPAGPSPVVLASGAASVYDPYGRVASAGVPAKGIDGNPSTSWFVDPTPKAGAGPDVGFLVDLGTKRDLRGLVVQTPTPGFRVEVYATDVASAPPDILDARWSHLRNRGNVGTNESIALRDDPTKYRKVMLWFRTAPTKGTRIRISELEVLS